MDPGRGDVGTSGVDPHEERGILANLEQNSPLRLPGLASQANGACCLVFMLYRCFEVPALSLIKEKKKKEKTTQWHGDCGGTKYEVLAS